jgi:hypothetical protein
MYKVRKKSNFSIIYLEQMKKNPQKGIACRNNSKEKRNRRHTK